LSLTRVISTRASERARSTENGLALPVGDRTRHRYLSRHYLSGAQKDKLVIPHLLLRYPLGRQDPSDRDRGRALYVVVERAESVSVLVQEAEGVVIAKVLELKRY